MTNNRKQQTGISFGAGAMILGCLWALGFASAGCRAGSSGAGRIEVTVDVDHALMLDTVHIEATAAGKPPLSQDLPLSGATSVRWTIGDWPYRHPGGKRNAGSGVHRHVHGLRAGLARTDRPGPLIS